MDLTREIDLILKDGYGLGADKAILLLVKEHNEIQNKIHLIKMVKFGQFLQDVISSSSILEEDIHSFSFNNGWIQTEDMAGFSGNQQWVFSIIPSDKSEINRSLFNKIQLEVNTEISGLGKINPRLLPKGKYDYSVTSFNFKSPFSDIKNNFLQKTVLRDVLVAFNHQYLSSTLSNKENSSPKSPKI